jgi:hypothetical protein
MSSVKVLKIKSAVSNGLGLKSYLDIRYFDERYLLISFKALL